MSRFGRWVYCVKKSSEVNTTSYKTISANKATVNKKWVIIDADGAVLGRMASKVAALIRGKYKTNFTPHVDCGDNVIVINADKVRLTGQKWENKKYISHSGYPGGQKIQSANEIKAKSSTKIIEMAVKGMLPKSRLGRQIYKNLFVYEGAEHPHEAQKPEKVAL